MNSPIGIEVEKGGELKIVATLSRSIRGLRLVARVQPEIEDLIKSWSDEKPLEVSQWGRNWLGPDGKTIDALAWSLRTIPGENGVLTTERGIHYCLDRVGGAFYEERKLPGLGTIPVLNLSFLRLVDISSSEGIGFVIKDVMETKSVIKLGEGIGSAVRHLYNSYCKPVDVSVILSTQVMR
jgi:hypothetical protein